MRKKHVGCDFLDLREFFFVWIFIVGFFFLGLFDSEGFDEDERRRRKKMANTHSSQ